MKFLLLLVLTFMTMLSARADWKIVASTTSCLDKIEVLAKEGETFVYVLDGGKKIKLDSVDGSAFSQESGKMVTFTNKNNSSLMPESKRFVFDRPSVVDGNPARLEILNDSGAKKCKMKLL